MLFNRTRQYNIKYFNTIFNKSIRQDKTRQDKTKLQNKIAISIKISNLLICLCSFDLSCPIFEKDNFIEMFYIVLSISRSASVPRLV